MAVSTLGRATEVERTGAAAAGATHLLYERHSTAVFRYCLSQLRSRPEAEDAVQTTFMYALRALERGVVPRIEIAWLLKIAQNVCRTTRKTAARRAERELASDPTVLAAAAPAPERHDAELMGLDKALLALPENQRRAVLLREWQGLSYAEIARTMKLSQAAVEMLLFRARRSLAESLGEETRPKRRRTAQFLDLGWLAWLKALTGGASIAKTAAAGAAAVVAVGALAASETPANGARAQESRVAATQAPLAAAAEASAQKAGSTQKASERARANPAAATGIGAHRPAELPASADKQAAAPSPRAKGSSGNSLAGATSHPAAAGSPDEPDATSSTTLTGGVEVPTLSEPQVPALPTAEVPAVDDVTGAVDDVTAAVGDVTEALPSLPDLPLP